MGVPMKVTVTTVAACFSAISGVAQAAGSWTDRVTIDGFASTIYQRTDENVLLNGNAQHAGIDEKGSFQGTKFALNINSDITSRLRLAGQFIGRSDEDYQVQVNWAFASFALVDDLDLRVGKIKYPVGLVNEYIDVGYAYPWLQAPLVIYSREINGPQAVREAFTGASLLWRYELNEDWGFETDLFAGEVHLDASDVKYVRGLTVRADWQGLVQIQASNYKGIMQNADPDKLGTIMSNGMNGKAHKASLIGAKFDWNNVVFYGEWATVEMGTSLMGNLHIMDSDSWYTTLGYRFGDLLPYYSYESLKQGDGDDQKFSTIGLRWDFMKNTDLKLAVTRIKTSSDTSKAAMSRGGLFQRMPSDNNTLRFGIGVDIVF